LNDHADASPRRYACTAVIELSSDAAAGRAVALLGSVLSGNACPSQAPGRDQSSDVAPASFVCVADLRGAHAHARGPRNGLCRARRNPICDGAPRLISYRASIGAPRLLNRRPAGPAHYCRARVIGEEEAVGMIVKRFLQGRVTDCRWSSPLKRRSCWRFARKAPWAEQLSASRASLAHSRTIDAIAAILLNLGTNQHMLGNQKSSRQSRRQDISKARSARQSGEVHAIMGRTARAIDASHVIAGREGYVVTEAK